MPTYAVICTFEIKNGTPQDYGNVFADLEKKYLSRVVNNNGVSFFLPGNSVKGAFTGATCESVREDVRSVVINSFTTRRLKAEIFIIVSGPEAMWSTVTT